MPALWASDALAAVHTVFDQLLRVVPHAAGVREQDGQELSAEDRTGQVTAERLRAGRGCTCAPPMIVGCLPMENPKANRDGEGDRKDSRAEQFLLRSRSYDGDASCRSPACCACHDAGIASNCLRTSLISWNAARPTALIENAENRKGAAPPISRPRKISGFEAQADARQVGASRIGMEQGNRRHDRGRDREALGKSLRRVAGCVESLNGLRAVLVSWPSPDIS